MTNETNGVLYIRCAGIKLDQIILDNVLKRYFLISTFQSAALRAKITISSLQKEIRCQHCGIDTENARGARS